jgi:hypothetical protein
MVLEDLIVESSGTTFSSRHGRRHGSRILIVLLFDVKLENGGRKSKRKMKRKDWEERKRGEVVETLFYDTGAGCLGRMRNPKIADVGGPAGPARQMIER